MHPAEHYQKEEPSELAISTSTSCRSPWTARSSLPRSLAPLPYARMLYSSTPRSWYLLHSSYQPRHLSKPTTTFCSGRLVLASISPKTRQLDFCYALSLIFSHFAFQLTPNVTLSLYTTMLVLFHSFMHFVVGFRRITLALSMWFMGSNTSYASCTGCSSLSLSSNLSSTPFQRNALEQLCLFYRNGIWLVRLFLSSEVMRFDYSILQQHYSKTIPFFSRMPFGKMWYWIGTGLLVFWRIWHQHSSRDWLNYICFPFSRFNCHFCFCFRCS